MLRLSCGARRCGWSARGARRPRSARWWGVARETVGRWVKAHGRGGDRALDARRRGRRPGHTRLSQAQQLRITQLVAGKNPDQLSLPGFLWTRALVAELIWRELEIKVSEETVGRYLRAWGFSPQKPMRRAYEQSDEAVRRWLEVDYPQLVKRAYRERAEILWADESGLRSDHTAGRSCPSCAPASASRPGSPATSKSATSATPRRDLFATYEW
jgi:transposase